jgi:hypothetical protein
MQFHDKAAIPAIDFNAFNSRILDCGNDAAPSNHVGMLGETQQLFKRVLALLIQKELATVLQLTTIRRLH